MVFILKYINFLLNARKKYMWTKCCYLSGDKIRSNPGLVVILVEFIHSVINSDSPLKSVSCHLSSPPTPPSPFTQCLLLFLQSSSLGWNIPVFFCVTSLGFICQAPWHFSMSTHGPMWLDWASSHHTVLGVLHVLCSIWLMRGSFPRGEGECYRNLKDCLCKVNSICFTTFL